MFQILRLNFSIRVRNDFSTPQYIVYFLPKPISANLSCKKPPAVISVYFFGLASSIQFAKQVKSISERGCIKKGIEYREEFIFSLGGFTTLCMVDFNLWLVSLSSISPTFTTI